MTSEKMQTSAHQKKELIIEFDYLEKQIKATSEKLDAFDKQAMQLTESIRAITELSQKNSHEALVPIVDGIYAKATITDTSSFLLDIGGDVATFKSAAEALAMVESQLKKTQEYQEKLVSRLQSFSTRADELQHELNALRKT